MKIPGVFLCLLLSANVNANCGYPAGALFKVARVVDGDTIKLEDGRLVRVLGVNAPEVAHGDKAAQPLGREARLAAQAFIQRAGGQVRLGFEQQREDRYGRLLAHVYDTGGRSLAASLLQQGMALQIAVPPNHAQALCLLAFERQARQPALGLWRSSYWNDFPAARLAAGEGGFRHVRGRVAQVDINTSVWIEFEGNLVLRVGKKDWPAFGYSRADWLALKGRELEVRGWVVARKLKASGGKSHGRNFKPLLLQLRSPSSLKVNH